MVKVHTNRPDSQLRALLLVAGVAAGRPLQEPFGVAPQSGPPGIAGQSTPARSSIIPLSPEYVTPFPLHESLRELYAAEWELERPHVPPETAATASASTAHPDPVDDRHSGHGHGHDLPSSPEKRAEMAALLDKYAPLFKMASTERYYPSSVDFMFKHYGFISWQNGTQYIPPAGTFDVSGMGDLPHHGERQLLSVNESCNPQPELEDEDSYFLYGPAGQPGAMEYVDGRGRVHDDVYGFWVDQGRGVVDMWYWTFYPYNLGKEVGYLGWLGNHVTDWERLRVRTVNGTAESADFNTHSGGAFSAGTYRWSDMETQNNRPVAYVASGSHGVWPTPGKHTYAQLLNLWALVDVTDDNGAIWDTKGHVVPIEWWAGPDKARRLYHTGNESWLEFRGKWGNRGSETCWWHPLVGICQLIDGPGGPNREFGYPPDCIIAEADWGKSTYSFFFSKNVTIQAPRHNITTVLVEQVCSRPTVSGVDVADATDEELDIWVEAERIPFMGRAEHHVTVDACGGGRSAAKAYRLALYDGLGQRVSTSDIRVLCLYEKGRKGWVQSNGGRVRDVDEWRWNLKDAYAKWPDIG